jgi:N-glycosylase/DNA lyase
VVRISAAEDGLTVESLDGRGIGGFDVEVRSYLSTEADLTRYRERFDSDPCIGPAVAGFPGLRLLRQDPWECLVSFICSSASNIPRIKLNVGSIAVSFGRRLAPGERDFEFPPPEAVAAAGEARLRALGLGFRAAFVAAAAEQLARGLDLTSLRTASYADARRVLMSLPGVGEKVADCVLAFSLDKPEAFPIDRWVRRALERWYGVSPKLSNSAVGDWARSHFGEYGALAQQYMFHRERLAGRAAAWGGRHVALALPEDNGR